MKKLPTVGCLFLLLTVFCGPVVGGTNIRIQTVMGSDSPEHFMLNQFASDVAILTGQEVTFEVLEKDAVVGTQGLIEAIDSGEIEAGFAWTHYWTAYHPAAMLFGSPTAGAGLGLDNISWLAWFLHGGGEQLYEELWREMGLNIKGLMLQPVGPEALGWFMEPITTMDDFRDYTYRAPPGIPGEAYLEVGVDAVTMAGGEILQALEAGTIDAAEWCCPYSDMIFGFHKVLKHYYLQGLHQNIVNTDLYINGDVWNSISEKNRKAIEIAAEASLIRTVTWRLHENGKALQILTDQHGVELHDTPDDYFDEYMEAAAGIYEELTAENMFFAKVYKSMQVFAKSAVPFWSGAQSSNAKIGMAFVKGMEE